MVWDLKKQRPVITLKDPNRHEAVAAVAAWERAHAFLNTWGWLQQAAAACTIAAVSSISTFV